MPLRPDTARGVEVLMWNYHDDDQRGGGSG